MHLMKLFAADQTIHGAQTGRRAAEEGAGGHRDAQHVPGRSIVGGRGHHDDRRLRPRRLRLNSRGNFLLLMFSFFLICDSKVF
jgi:hypothetical protein